MTEEPHRSRRMAILKAHPEVSYMFWTDRVPVTRQDKVELSGAACRHHS